VPFFFIGPGLMHVALGENCPFQAAARRVISPAVLRLVSLDHEFSTGRFNGLSFLGCIQSKAAEAASGCYREWLNQPYNVA